MHASTTEAERVSATKAERASAGEVVQATEAEVSLRNRGHLYFTSCWVSLHPKPCLPQQLNMKLMQVQHKLAGEPLAHNSNCMIE